MKRRMVFGLVLVVVAIFILGNSGATKTAEFSNPDPKGIIIFQY